MTRSRLLLLATPLSLIVTVILAQPAAADNCDIFINAEDCQNTAWTVGIIATLAGGVAVATAATLASKPPPVDDKPTVGGIAMRAMFTKPTTTIQPRNGVVSARSMKLVAHADQGRQTFREDIVDQTELVPGVTARQAAFGRHGSNEALIHEMTSNSPDGIASTRLGGRRPQSQAGYRLLDSRILEFGLEFLDQELSKPLVSGLAKYRALVEAARKSLADPEQGEVAVTLIDSHEITSTHSPYVSLEADNAEITRIDFELKLVFGMFQTAVAVRRGAIESVICEACSLSVTLSLTGWEPPLLQRKVQLPVRLPVKPPERIPLPDPA